MLVSKLLKLLFLACALYFSVEGTVIYSKAKPTPSSTTTTTTTKSSSYYTTTQATTTTRKTPWYEADVPAFNNEYIYESTYSPDGIANQLLQNFFNWLCPTVFWFTMIPFYTRLEPIFNQPAARTEDQKRIFGDVQTVDASVVYSTTFSPEGVLLQMVQNFWNFFINTMFWLAYIPFYERYYRIFGNDPDTSPEVIGRSYDVPAFNVTDIYLETFSPSGIAVQLLQNFFNFLSSTVYWLTYTPFYVRMFPIFFPQNIQRRSEESFLNPSPYFKHLLIDKNNISLQGFYGTKSRLIRDLKQYLYGDELIFYEGQVVEDGEGRFFFGDPWTANLTNVYEGTYSPTGIIVQLVQNFFGFFAGTMFWLTYIPFYERFFPVFNETSPSSSPTSGNYAYNFDLYYLNSESRSLDDEKVYQLSFSRFANLLRAFADVFENILSFLVQSETTDDEFEAKTFGDVPHFNATDIYVNLVAPEGLLQLHVQNFFNFFTSTMFWLSFIPFYERLYPVFVPYPEEGISAFAFADSPDFNQTTIYKETFSPSGIAIQLLQNFFNWFTTTVFWFPVLMFYDRIYPIFSIQNNQRSFDEDFQDGVEDCSNILALLANRLIFLLRSGANVSDGIQWLADMI